MNSAMTRLATVLPKLSAQSQAIMLEELTAHVEGRQTFDEAMSAIRSRAEAHLGRKIEWPS